MSDAPVAVKRGPGRPPGTGYPTGPRRKKYMTEALDVVLNRIEMNDLGEAKKNFMIIAEELVRQAKAGEPWAIKEILDRVEGKPTVMVEDEAGRRLPAYVSIAFVGSDLEEDDD